MKRSQVLISLIVVVAGLAVAPLARAEADADPAASVVATAIAPVLTPDGFSWDEAAATNGEPAPNGFSWDEDVASSAEAVPDGFSWDEAAPAVAV